LYAFSAAGERTLSLYDDGFAGPIYNQDDPGYTDASSTQVYDDGFAGPIDMMHQYILDHPDYILDQRTHHHILVVLGFSKGREENSFSEKPLALGGVQVQCVTPKDDSKLSTVEWAVPISVLSVMATSTAVGYYMLKRPVSPGGAPNTDTLEISNDGYLAPSNARFRVRLNNTSSEPLSVEYNEISAVPPIQLLIALNRLLV
jgi:hypothetical protein